MRAKKLLGLISGLALAASTQAAPLNFWNEGGWTMLDNDDGVMSGGYVDPGWGGQDFDAEYLFYRVDNNILSLGIQAGYNLESGLVNHSGKNYYAGDLAIAIDGGGYDYAIDFGLLTKDYSNHNVEADSNGDGIDAAGFYAVSAWNNNVYFQQSAPFAMDAGTYLTGLVANEAGYDSVLDSYFRTVSIDLNNLGFGNEFDLGLHWTMSCGNDALDGSTSVTAVPEPHTAALLLLGLAGLWGRRRLIG